MSNDISIKIEIRDNNLVVELYGDGGGTWGYCCLDSDYIPLTDLKEALANVEPKSKCEGGCDCRK